MFNPTLKLMGRRQFLGVAGMGALALSEMDLLKACNSITPSQLISEIQAWVPTVTTAVTNLLNLLGSLNIIPLGAGTAAAALIVMVSGGVTAVLAAISEYLNDPAADKATLWGKIKSILSAIADNVSTFVTAVNLSGNPIAATIINLVALLINTITGFINAIPATATKVTAVFTKTTVTVGGTIITLKPKALNRSDFTANWNGYMGPKYQQYCIY